MSVDVVGKYIGSRTLGQRWMESPSCLCVCVFGDELECLHGVCVGVDSQWSPVHVCMRRVSGGQRDKGACFPLIRTPTSTSLSLYCSSTLLSILPPFSSVPVVTPLSLFCLPLSLSLSLAVLLVVCYSSALEMLLYEDAGAVL